MVSGATPLAGILSPPGMSPVAIRVPSTSTPQPTRATSSPKPFGFAEIELHADRGALEVERLDRRRPEGELRPLERDAGEIRQAGAASGDEGEEGEGDGLLHGNVPQAFGGGSGRGARRRGALNSRAASDGDSPRTRDGRRGRRNSHAIHARSTGCPQRFTPTITGVFHRPSTVIPSDVAGRLRRSHGRARFRSTRPRGARRAAPHRPRPAPQPRGRAGRPRRDPRRRDRVRSGRGAHQVRRLLPARAPVRRTRSARSSRASRRRSTRSSCSSGSTRRGLLGSAVPRELPLRSRAPSARPRTCTTTRAPCRSRAAAPDDAHRPAGGGARVRGGRGRPAVPRSPSRTSSARRRAPATRR